MGKRRKDKKRSGLKSKPKQSLVPIWTKQGYVPDKLSTKERHKKGYESRMGKPDGKGTGRSSGSDKRLRKLSRIIR